MQATLWHAHVTQDRKSTSCSSARGLQRPQYRGPQRNARHLDVDFGLTERNPETGDWFINSGRYTVRLDGPPEGRLVRVRTANVEEEEEDATGDAGGGQDDSGKKEGASKGKKVRRGRGRK